MVPKSEKFKAELAAVRARISIAKRRGRHRGFIDYHGCISVCQEFIDIIEYAGKVEERGEFVLAYSIVALVLINSAKLASSADDSAGGITDTQCYVKEALDKICSSVEYGSDDAEQIFLQALKDSQNKAFDGWDDFVYDLLQPIARLATAKNSAKLYAILDGLDEKLSRARGYRWYLENDRLVRLAAITAVDGEQAAEDFIAENLKYDSIRRVAVRKAVDKGDFARAEKLCLDKVNSSDWEYRLLRQWYDELFEIYIQTADSEKQTDLARELLIHERDAKYYPVLKRLLTKKGVWDREYPALLRQLSESLYYGDYLKILSQEGEKRLLLEEIRKHPSSVFDYGKQLSAEFSTETYALCLDEIRSRAAAADTRIKYRKVCGLIKKLFMLGGIAEADGIIAELRDKNPRRPALLDELDTLELKLSKKR